MLYNACAMRHPADRLALGLLVGITALHVLLALRFPLAPDETYYWEWSRQLDWGYYDQGPVIAWLIRASTELFGSTELGVRGGIVLTATLTLALVYWAGRRLSGAWAGLLAMLCAAVTPMGTVGGFVATYDVPLVLFWTMAICCLVWATEGNEALHAGRINVCVARGWLPWVLLGIAGGLGVSSKYTMVLAVPCAVLYLYTQPDLRPWLRRPHPYVALAIAVALVMPNLVWQARHEWVSVLHVSGLTAKADTHGPLRRLGDFIGSQIGLVTPLLFGGMSTALWSIGRPGRRLADKGTQIGFWFSVPVLLLFVLLSLKAKVQANWAVCGWVGAALAYAGWVFHGGSVDARHSEKEPREVAGSGSQPARHRRRLRYAAVATGLAAIISLLAGWPEFRVAVGLRIPARLDQSRKMYGGRELATACVQEMRKMAREGVAPIVGAATYDNASRLAFYLPGQPRVYCFFLGTRDNQYRFLNAAAGLTKGRNALIVDHRPPDDPLLPAFHTLFERVEPVREPVVVWVRPIYDEPVVTYYLYRCYRYRGSDADAP